MRYSLFIILLFFFQYAGAQHCPFDGSYSVVIKVVNKKGRPIDKLPIVITLQEQQNPKADSCYYSEGLFSDTFHASYTAMMNEESRAWKSRAEQFAHCALFGKGCFMVLMNMAERDCMVPHGNDYEYISRRFAVVYTHTRTKKKVVLPIKPEQVYKMCTASGSWCRINPIKITVE